jgi:dipeptidyl aminopeptidase/acylaminoacyl peptidase
VLAFADGGKSLGEPRQLTFGNIAITNSAWTADGREIIFADWRWSNLWRVAARGSMRRPDKPRPLGSLGQSIFDPAISRRGNRLAYGHASFHASIGRIAAPVAGSKSPVMANGGRTLISSSRNDYDPQFSPDGTRIAFVSARSGHPEIWVCNGDGSNAVQLTSFAGPWVTTPQWSPDGERIAFDSNAAGEFDIYVIDANGGNPQRMTTHPANDGNPSWSHDGRWIYFDSGRAGAQQVFKIPPNGGGATQVTRDGGFAPVESPDGKSLYYTKALGATSSWRIPAEGGHGTKIVDGLSSYINVAIAESGVYFVPLQKPNSIQFLSFATNQIRPVASFENPIDVSGSVSGLALSPDRRWMLFTQWDQAGSELMLVENFR